MTDKQSLYQSWLEALLKGFNKQSQIDDSLYENIWHYPEFIYFLIDKILEISNTNIEELQDLQASYLYAFTVCLTQFKSGMDAKIKHMERHLKAAMDYMAEKINIATPNINFWMMFLNAFYDCQIELSPALKEAYFNMMEQQDSLEDDYDPLDSLVQYLEDLEDASTYEKADNIFVQGYAMPAELFTDLVYDLLFLDQGRDVAVLALLHPNSEVRSQVIEILYDLRREITWSSKDLLRLRMIRPWLSEQMQLLLEEILHEQRIQGGVFAPLEISKDVETYASEIDGSGGQCILFCWPKTLTMSGVLLKQPNGIKDVWYMQLADKKSYAQSLKMNGGGITLKNVSLVFIKKIFSHFLALNKINNLVPPIHFLEIQEKLGIEFKPQLIDLNTELQQECTKIYPFNDETIEQAKHLTKDWVKNKPWAKSWYIESEKIDHIIMQFSYYEHGKLHCQTAKAVKNIVNQFFTTIKSFWSFHFYWVALWLTDQGEKYEKMAEASKILAYLLSIDYPLDNIPIMNVIGKKSLVFCSKTLQERKAYLNTAN